MNRRALYLTLGFGLFVVAVRTLSKSSPHVSNGVGRKLPLAKSLPTIEDSAGNYDIDGVSYDSDGVVVSGDGQTADTRL